MKFSHALVKLCGNSLCVLFKRVNRGSFLKDEKIYVAAGESSENVFLDFL